MSNTPDEPSATSNPNRLRDHFLREEASTHGSKWNELWKEGFVPWDKGIPNPALVDLLAERKDLFPSTKGRKKAMVPGCGKGYDVLLLSSWGFDAYGLEISSNALEAARQTEKEMAGKGIYETKDGVQKGTITWLAGDFFKDEVLKSIEGEATFDLIYDYTFLCALPPSLRPAWSIRMVELLAPEGRLVCIEFPTYKNPSLGGPPWALPPKIYTALLPRPGKELLYGEDGHLLESKLEEPSKNGLQQIAHFQPKRTHEVMGYNKPGNITDWIGIWVHPKTI